MLNKKLVSVKIDFLITAFLFILSPLFFYNLGASSLVDFDEGWYAEIARNIIKNKDLFLLTFNQQPYFDHPPLGFQLMALSFLAFGVTEFAARFPSALLGFGSVVLTYLIGKNLFSKTVGLGASFILMSSVWFIIRARSRDLDTIFLFFYLLTFYAAIKSKNNPKWFYLFFVSLALTLLTKSIIGLTILVPTIIYFLIFRFPPHPRALYLGIVIFVAMITPWLVINDHALGPYFLETIKKIGFKSEYKTAFTFSSIPASNTIAYLHYGVREWFYPAMIALFGSIIFVFKYRQLLAIYSVILVLFYGFLTSSKTEIWHLIPLYPFFALLIAFFLEIIVKNSLKFMSYLEWVSTGSKTSQKLLKLLAVILVLFPLSALSLKQILEFKDEAHFFQKKTTNGLAYVSSQAKGRSEKLFLDNTHFLRSTVFYSQKKVYHLQDESPPKNTLAGIIGLEPEPFLILTERWKVDADKIDSEKFEVLADYDNRLLLLVK